MYEYKVLNVKCEGCARTLKEKLYNEFGEVEVDLSVMPRVITLKKEPDTEKLRVRLKELGYPMVDEEMGFVEDVGAKAKSFVSCAIGKGKNFVEKE